MITYKTPTAAEQLLTSYRNLALNKTKNKPNVLQGLASAVESTINPWFQPEPSPRKSSIGGLYVCVGGLTRGGY